MTDFSPEEQTRSVTYWTGRREQTKHYPTAGNVVRIAYIETALAHEDAVDALLEEVQAYAVPSGYEKLAWAVTAKAGRDACVDVRVTVNLDTVDPTAADEFEGLVVCELDSNPAERWQSSYGGAYIDVSTESDTGDGSIQWGHELNYPTKCGIQSPPGKFNSGSALDCSGYNSATDQLGIIIQMPSFTYFDDDHDEPIFIELGTDMTNYTRWVFDPAVLLAAGVGQWATLWADIGDGTITGGTGAGDLSAINMARIVVETAQDQETAIVALADRILLREV